MGFKEDARSYSPVLYFTCQWVAACTNEYVLAEAKGVNLKYLPSSNEERCNACKSRKDSDVALRLQMTLEVL